MLPGYMVNLLTGETGLAMELDTRASVSIVSKETWKTIHSTSLESSMVQLKTYSGEYPWPETS